ncbi:MAG: hypothetical protein KatS3mg012_1659 [Gaiellaceae bacterium]|jgi:hypothetical protein|nr:MAG: hypothetical protein KatS3mg012_1659 [Gaiellaceae bacterium]
MADRASDPERGPLGTLALAGIGALVLAADRIDELAEEIAARLGADREDVLAALREALGGGRRELEELELRVAQLEHRVRLLERSSG